MKKYLLSAMIICLLLIQPLAFALTASEAKQAWRDSKSASRDAQSLYRDAKADYAGNKSAENNQREIDNGKEVLLKALDEAEAWLIWANLEVTENPEVPDDLKADIQADVDKNLATVGSLRQEVNQVQNRLQLGMAFIRMIVKYFELISDVARNTGNFWVHLANNRADAVAEYEIKLREVAMNISDNAEILEKLDFAKEEIESARSNIMNADSDYDQVIIGGSPLAKFSNGNSYLRIARGDLISATGHLKQAYRLMLRSGE